MGSKTFFIPRAPAATTGASLQASPLPGVLSSGASPRASRAILGAPVGSLVAGCAPPAPRLSYALRRGPGVRLRAAGVVCLSVHWYGRYHGRGYALGRLWGR